MQEKLLLLRLYLQQLLLHPPNLPLSLQQVEVSPQPPVSHVQEGTAGSCTAANE